jgi:nucleoside-diphosphate-sugar epimerase
MLNITECKMDPADKVALVTGGASGIGLAICKELLQNKVKVFLISNFRRVQYVVCFLLGSSPASEFYMPTFRNTLFHLHRQVG